MSSADSADARTGGVAAAAAAPEVEATAPSSASVVAASSSAVSVVAASAPAGAAEASVGSGCEAEGVLEALEIMITSQQGRCYAEKKRLVHYTR